MYRLRPLHAIDPASLIVVFTPVCDFASPGTPPPKDGMLVSPSPSLSSHSHDSLTTHPSPSPIPWVLIRPKCQSSDCHADAGASPTENNAGSTLSSQHRRLLLPGAGLNTLITTVANVRAPEVLEMETITIPSPSVFLDSPVIKPAPEPPPLPPQPKRKSSSASKAADAPKKQNGAVKPKQSKSRNGMLLE